VVDLGSGTGYVTAVAASIAREVRSYEADPRMAQVARTTLARNGLTARVENAVLARSPTGQATEFSRLDDFWSSRLEPVNGAQHIQVPVLDLLGDLDGCSYMIVDIEGAEVDVLAGDLPGVRAICVETQPQLTSNRRINEMLTALFAQGFGVDFPRCHGSVLYIARDGAQPESTGSSGRREGAGTRRRHARARRRLAARRLAARAQADDRPTE